MLYYSLNKAPGGWRPSAGTPPLGPFHAKFLSYETSETVSDQGSNNLDRTVQYTFRNRHSVHVLSSGFSTLNRIRFSEIIQSDHNNKKDSRNRLHSSFCVCWRRHADWQVKVDTADRGPVLRQLTKHKSMPKMGRPPGGTPVKIFPKVSRALPAGPLHLQGCRVPAFQH